RFLSLFLDMTSKVGGKPVHVDTLGDPALWQSAPIEPKTPPNPLKNDKPFLTKFPYLAEPWPENYHPGEPTPSYKQPTTPKPPSREVGRRGDDGLAPRDGDFRCAVGLRTWTACP